MTIDELNSELSDVIVNFHNYHSDMETHRNYYLHSVFYKPKSGESPMRKELVINLLKVFADKNVHYTSQLPTMKVPGTQIGRAHV